MTHGPSDASNQKPLQASALTFVTFLYAAAVHLVIHHSVLNPINYSTALGVLVLVVFMFSDWSNRTRIPSNVIDNIPPVQLLAKTLLEIAGLFFLVISFLRFVHPQQPVVPATLSAEPAFAFFLLFTWVWNMLIIYIMDKLDLSDLVPALICGSTDTLPKVNAHLGPFQRWRASLTSQYEERETRWQNLSRGLFPEQAAILKHINRARNLFFMLLTGAVVAALHLLTFHVVLANLLASLLILLHSFAVQPLPFFPVGSRPSLPAIFASLLLCVVVASLCFAAKRWQKVFRVIGASLVTIVLSAIYLLLAPTELVLLLAVQQILANLFLQAASGTAQEVATNAPVCPPTGGLSDDVALGEGSATEGAPASATEVA